MVAHLKGAFAAQAEASPSADGVSVGSTVLLVVSGVLMFGAVFLRSRMMYLAAFERQHRALTALVTVPSQDDDVDDSVM